MEWSLYHTQWTEEGSVLFWAPSDCFLFVNLNFLPGFNWHTVYIAYCWQNQKFAVWVYTQHWAAEPIYTSVVKIWNGNWLPYVIFAVDNGWRRRVGDEYRQSFHRVVYTWNTHQRQSFGGGSTGRLQRVSVQWHGRQRKFISDRCDVGRGARDPCVYLVSDLSRSAVV